jgi:hypothetical protein
VPALCDGFGVHYKLFSPSTAVKTCKHASACAAMAMACAGCGDTESDGAIFGSADGRCLRCNRPTPADVAPTSVSETAREAKSAELNAQTVAQLEELCRKQGVSTTAAKAELVARLCDALCTDGPAAKRPRTAVRCRSIALRSGFTSERVHRGGAGWGWVGLGVQRVGGLCMCLRRCVSSCARARARACVWVWVGV